MAMEPPCTDDFLMIFPFKSPFIGDSGDFPLPFFYYRRGKPPRFAEAQAVSPAEQWPELCGCGTNGTHMFFTSFLHVLPSSYGQRYQDSKSEL